jgi:Zn-dependent protease
MTNKVWETNFSVVYLLIFLESKTMTETRIATALMELGVLVFSLCFHEFGHALAATKLGDPTPKMLGRLTMDPRPHVDPIGTLLFPMIMFLYPGFFLFGWARPVPITPQNFKKPRRDGALVALAGPTMNLILVAVSFMIFIGVQYFSFFGLDDASVDVVGRFFQFFFLLNAALAVFNLVPIYPLDGSWILKAVLPPKWSYQVSRLDPYGFFILLGLFFLLRWL